jgi:hypothetical protein
MDPQSLFFAHCGGNLGRRLGQAALGHAHLTKDCFSSPLGSGFFLPIFRFFNGFLFSLFQTFSIYVLFSILKFFDFFQILKVV